MEPQRLRGSSAIALSARERVNDERSALAIHGFVE